MNNFVFRIFQRVLHTQDYVMKDAVGVKRTATPLQHLQWGLAYDILIYTIRFFIKETLDTLERKWLFFNGPKMAKIAPCMLEIEVIH